MGTAAMPRLNQPHRDKHEPHQMRLSANLEAGRCDAQKLYSITTKTAAKWRTAATHIRD